MAPHGQDPSPLLTCAAQRLACILCLIWLCLAPQARAQQDRKNFISHGPILGRLSSDGVGIWARTGYPGTFAARYGLSPDRLDSETQPVSTALDHDNTGWIHLAGLRPDTRYYYELVLPGIDSLTGRKGRFRTLPDPNALKDPALNPQGLFNFSFEFACGNNQTPGQGLGPEMPALKTMLDHLQDKIHFAILNGDWAYETRRDYRSDQWLSQVNCPASKMPEVLRVAPTLAGVWENYKFYLEQSPPLARWHCYVPSYFTYDDHEILNDVYGTATPGLRDRRAVFRDIGVRGWYDYLGWSNPVTFTQPSVFGRTRLVSGSDLLVDPNADFSTLDLGQTINLHVHWGTDSAGVNNNALDGVGGQANAGVYRIVRIKDRHTLQIEPPAKAHEVNSYSIGRRSYFRMRVANCEFFVLDTRGQRQWHDIRDPGKKGLSMLGPDQYQWLVDGLSHNEADFLFVVSSVNLTIPHVGGPAIRQSGNKDEAWTVFLDERERLIDLCSTLRRPVFVLTGDLHNSFVVQVTDNLWELAAGPHNSMNHRAAAEANRPPNGRFQSGPRSVDIHWSTYFLDDVPPDRLSVPTYCVIQVNNVFANADKQGRTRWVAFPRPQVVVQYYDGITGDLRYAESVRGRTGTTAQTPAEPAGPQ